MYYIIISVIIISMLAFCMVFPDIFHFFLFLM